MERSFLRAGVHRLFTLWGQSLPKHPFPESEKGLYCSRNTIPDSLRKRPDPVRYFPLHMSDDTEGPGNDIGLMVKPKSKTQRPPMYKVMLLNDDYTPMEFVVHVLERFFGVNHAQAFDIMLTVHKKGLAVVGVYSHEVAETKVAQVMDFARRHQHPLQCTMEKE